MSCTSTGIASTIIHVPGDSVAPDVIDVLLSDNLAQVARGVNELSVANTVEVTLQAKPREVSKGQIVAVHESLFGTTWFGVVTGVEYRVTVDDQTTILPSMNLTIARYT